ALGHRPGDRDLPLRVAGGGDRAEPRGRLVGLRQRHQEALDTGGAADQDQQQPGGERVERPGVADPHAARATRAPTHRAAHPCDDVVRGDPGRLVVQDDAVGHFDGATPDNCCATSSRRNATSSSRPIAVENPAAWRWPPPPWARAIAEAATRSSLARSETFLGGPPLAEIRSRIRAATAVPSTARRWSITPSE